MYVFCAMYCVFANGAYSGSVGRVCMFAVEVTTAVLLVDTGGRVLFTNVNTAALSIKLCL